MVKVRVRGKVKIGVRIRVGLVTLWEYKRWEKFSRCDKFSTTQARLSVGRTAFLLAAVLTVAVRTSTAVSRCSSGAASAFRRRSSTARQRRRWLAQCVDLVSSTDHRVQSMWRSLAGFTDVDGFRQRLRQRQLLLLRQTSTRSVVSNADDTTTLSRISNLPDHGSRLVDWTRVARTLRSFRRRSNAQKLQRSAAIWKLNDRNTRRVRQSQ